MGVLRVLSHHGDDKTEWSYPAVLTGDEEARRAVEEAERIFADQRARGATAVRVSPGQPAQRIDSFDPAAEEIVMIPAWLAVRHDRASEMSASVVLVFVSLIAMTVVGFKIMALMTMSPFFRSRIWPWLRSRGWWPAPAERAAEALLRRLLSVPSMTPSAAMGSLTYPARNIPDVSIAFREGRDRCWLSSVAACWSGSASSQPRLACRKRMSCSCTSCCWKRTSGAI